MAAKTKVRVGVSFDAELVQAIDGHVRALKELGVDRSEVVDAILSEFFEGGDSTEATWEVVERYRARRRGR